VFANLKALGAQFIHVPILFLNVKLSEVQITNIDQMIAFADGPSAINPKVKREGVVFKEMFGGASWKAISNAYLLSEKVE